MATPMPLGFQQTVILKNMIVKHGKSNCKDNRKK